MSKIMSLIEIFVKPRRVFERLKKKPDFLYPIIVILLIQIFSGYKTYGIISKTIPKIPFILPILSSVISSFINVLSLWIIFLIIIFLIGKRGKYKNLLSVILYGYLPNSLIILLRSLLGLPGRGIGIGGILPSNTSRYLFNLLKGVDIFYIWSIVLIIYGIVILYELKNKETVWVILLFILYILIQPLIFLGGSNKTQRDNTINRPLFRFLRPRVNRPIVPKP